MDQVERDISERTGRRLWANMDDVPLVSVVIPNLNRASFLRQTIESVLVQDYPSIECIIVDGGSTDGSIDVLRSYGESVEWISEPDQGHADAINKGWRMSHGDLLAWLNADDVYVRTDAVRRSVEFLRKHEDADVVYGDYVEIDAAGRIITEQISPKVWNLVYAVLHCDYVIPQASSFMRRRIVEAVGWLDPEFRYCKDHELWLRIGLVGTIRYAPVLVAGVRKVPGISQHLETGRAKVRLTEKFLARSDLPEPFSRPGFRRRALSNSHLVGGLYAFESGHPLAAGADVVRAVRQEPRNAPYIAFRIGQYGASKIIPTRFRKVARQLLKRLGVRRRNGWLHRFE